MSDIVKKSDGGSTAMMDPVALLRQMFTWDPFRDVGLGTLPRGTLSTNGMLPSFDVKETAEGFTIVADLPGVLEKDVEITLAGNRLTISGHREAEERKEGERWHSVERTSGRFSRSFLLPEDIEGDKVKADLKAGVLNLSLPRKPECQPRQIKVKAS